MNETETNANTTMKRTLKGEIINWSHQFSYSYVNMGTFLDDSINYGPCQNMSEITWNSLWFATFRQHLQCPPFFTSWGPEIAWVGYFVPFIVFKNVPRAQSVEFPRTTLSTCHQLRKFRGRLKRFNLLDQCKYSRGDMESCSDFHVPDGIAGTIFWTYQDIQYSVTPSGFTLR